MDGFKPCPFCGMDKLAAIRNPESAEIRGIYCLRCKTEVRFPGIVMHANETYGDNETRWRERWNMWGKRMGGQ